MDEGMVVILEIPCAEKVVSNTTCFFVYKSFRNLDFKGILQ